MRLFPLPVLLIAAAVLLLLVVTSDADGSGKHRALALEVALDEFGTGWLGHCMFRIAGRETGQTFDPRATIWRDLHADGSRGSFGLWQIGALHRAAGEAVDAFRRRMYRPRANARLAHRLYRRGGLTPWGGRC